MTRTALVSFAFLVGCVVASAQSAPECVADSDCFVAGASRPCCASCCECRTAISHARWDAMQRQCSTIECSRPDCSHTRCEPCAEVHFAVCDHGHCAPR